MDINTALQEVLKDTTMLHDGLAREFTELPEALDKRHLSLCAASNCDEPVYIKLVELVLRAQINLRQR